MQETVCKIEEGEEKCLCVWGGGYWAGRSSKLCVPAAHSARPARPFHLEVGVRVGRGPGVAP